MAEACQHTDKFEAAEAHYLEALEIASGLGLRPELAHCQAGLAQTYSRLGRRDEADRLLEAARQLYFILEMPATFVGLP
jgi:tetratricopeptide (TPR) repeat protein